MNLKKGVLVIFCMVLPLFLTLLSYNMILIGTDFTPNQKLTMVFLNGNSELSVPFSQEAMSHMDDVKDVMNKMKVTFYLGLIIILGIILRYRKDSFFSRKLFFYGGITTTSVLGVILLIALFGFNYLFTVFHQIFFPQGNWMFPIDSLLIQTFPIEFFIAITGKIFLLTLVFGLFFLGVGYRMRHLRHIKKEIKKD